MDWPLRFGIFLAPFHPCGQNPTLALAENRPMFMNDTGAAVMTAISRHAEEKSANTAPT